MWLLYTIYYAALTHTGELTEEGYRKKLARVENEYGHSDIETPKKSASEIAKKFENPTSSALKEKIKSLFGKKRPSLSLKETPQAKRLKAHHNTERR